MPQDVKVIGKAVSSPCRRRAVWAAKNKDDVSDKKTAQEALDAHLIKASNEMLASFAESAVKHSNQMSDDYISAGIVKEIEKHKALEDKAQERAIKEGVISVKGNHSIEEIEAMTKRKREFDDVIYEAVLKPESKPKRAKKKSQGKVKKNVNKTRNAKSDSG